MASYLLRQQSARYDQGKGQHTISPLLSILMLVIVARRRVKLARTNAFVVDTVQP